MKSLIFIEEALDKLRCFMSNSKNMDSLNRLQCSALSHCFGLLVALLDSFKHGDI